MISSRDFYLLQMNRCSILAVVSSPQSRAAFDPVSQTSSATSGVLITSSQCPRRIVPLVNPPCPFYESINDSEGSSVVTKAIIALLSIASL